jgi:hypothetical protein
MRIAIAGVPRAGKSTFALQLARATGFPVVHADDFIALGWSEASDEVARRLYTPGPYIIEGVAVIRGLRKALDIGPDRPCDRLHWFGDAREAHSRGQASMATADRNRFAQLREELERRGVRIVEGAAVLGPPCGPTPPPLRMATLEAAAEPPARQTAALPAQLPVPEIESRWAGASGRGFG